MSSRRHELVAVGTIVAVGTGVLVGRGVDASLDARSTVGAWGSSGVSMA